MTVHDEPEDGAKYIVLGSVFLARWYSVFDYDNAQISCKFILVMSNKESENQIPSIVATLKK